MHWFGFWIFLAVFVACDYWIFAQGYDSFFHSHRTDAEKELQRLKIDELRRKVGRPPPQDRTIWAEAIETMSEEIMSERTLTCVYCGHEYPQDTPAHGSKVLTDHIKVCERHPMRKAESDITLLRSALVGLIGADTEDELRQMESAVRLLPAPDEDKAVSINAIHALLSTMTPTTEPASHHDD